MSTSLEVSSGSSMTSTNSSTFCSSTHSSRVDVSSSINSSSQMNADIIALSSQSELPAPTVCRNYKCAKCSFVSTRAKLFLFHQKEAHGENIAVYGCNHCEYASRHKNKVMRHKRLVHKISDTGQGAESPQNVAGESTARDDSDLTVTATTVVHAATPTEQISVSFINTSTISAVESATAVSAQVTSGTAPNGCQAHRTELSPVSDSSGSVIRLSSSALNIFTTNCGQSSILVPLLPITSQTSPTSTVSQIVQATPTSLNQAVRPAVIQPSGVNHSIAVPPARPTLLQMPVATAQCVPSHAPNNAGRILPKLAQPNKSNTVTNSCVTPPVSAGSQSLAQTITSTTAISSSMAQATTAPQYFLAKPGKNMTDACSGGAAILKQTGKLLPRCSATSSHNIRNCVTSVVSTKSSQSNATSQITNLAVTTSNVLTGNVVLGMNKITSSSAIRPLIRPLISVVSSDAFRPIMNTGSNSVIRPMISVLNRLPENSGGAFIENAGYPKIAGSQCISLLKVDNNVCNDQDDKKKQELQGEDRGNNTTNVLEEERNASVQCSKKSEGTNERESDRMSDRASDQTSALGATSDCEEGSQDGSAGTSCASNLEFSDGVYRCKLCRYSNVHKWKIASHARASHSHRTVFRCAFCSFCTERRIEWCAHKTVHSGKAVFACGECAYQTTMKRNYERHLERHIMNGPRRCSLCSYSSTGEGAIQRHMAEYHPPSPGKGVESGVIAVSRESVGRDAATPESCGSLHTGSCRSHDVMSEDLCGSSECFADESGSKFWSGSLGGLESMNCEASMDGSLAGTDSRLGTPLTGPSTNGRWSCLLCTLHYKRPADLNRHMKHKHGVSLRDVQQQQQQQHQQQQQQLLRRHDKQSNSITLSSESEIKLPPAHSLRTMPTSHFTGYDLTVNSREDQPLNLSLKEEKQEVTVCVPAQNEPLDLSVGKSQEEITSPQISECQAKLKCSRCPYISKRASDMRRHALVHCAEKRYRCVHCAKSYKLQFDLNRHLSKTHGVNAKPTTRSSDPISSDSEHSLAGIVIPGIPSALQELNRTAEFANSIILGSDAKTSDPGGRNESFCEANSERSTTTDKHMQNMHAATYYRCRFCKLAAASRSDMRRHLVKHHGKEFTCEGDLIKLLDVATHKGKVAGSSVGTNVIKEIFVSREANVDHNMNVDHQLKANVHHHHHHCHKDHSSKYNDNNGHHNVHHHKIGDQKHLSTLSLKKPSGLTRPYRCPLCSFTSERASKIKTHLEAHDNLLRFQCALCGKRTNWVWCVRRHIRKHHPDADVMIKELSESDAQNSLKDYLNGISKIEKSPKVENVDDEADDDDEDKGVLVDNFNVNLRNAVESQALESTLKNDKLEVERLAEQYANEVTAMFYGNQSHDVSQKTGSQCDGSVRSFDSNACDGAAGKRSLVRTSSSAAKRYRPYKCSQCGRRSNWRWDLNKHIRASHPTAHLIEMTASEARETFHEILQRDIKCVAAESTPKVNFPIVTSATTATAVTPQTGSLASAPSWRNKPFQCNACGHRSNWKCDVMKHIRALHPTARVITLDDDQARETLAQYDELHTKISPIVSTATKSVEIIAVSMEKYRPMRSEESSRQSSVVTPPQSYTVDAMKLKRFQCSACPYRSNFRSDVGRHIRHKHDKTTCRIIVLTEADASSTLKVYLDTWARKKFVPSPSKRRSGLTNTLAMAPAVANPGTSAVGDRWKCKICEYRSSAQECILKHCLEAHAIKFAANNSSTMQIVNNSVLCASDMMMEITDDSTGSPAKNEDDCNGDADQVNVNTKPNLTCDICPFQTTKSGLLAIHKTYHKPNSKNKFKCKICPYYVSAVRLLHQHKRLHTHAVSSGKISDRELTVRKGGRTRYLCAKCPYISCNRNDYRYHAEFHVLPSKVGSFECDACSFVVNKKRLMTQHHNVHTAVYMKRREMYDRLVAARQNKLSKERDNNMLPNKFLMADSQVESTVENDLNMPTTDLLKTREGNILISEKNSSLSKFLTPKSDDRAAISTKQDGAESDLKILLVRHSITQPSQDGLIPDGACSVSLDTSRLYDATDSMYHCARCSYADPRSDNMECHLRTHKPRKELQCVYCEYSTSRVHMLSQHVRKVHGVRDACCYPTHSITEIMRLANRRRVTGKKLGLGRNGGVMGEGRGHEEGKIITGGPKSDNLKMKFMASLELQLCAL